MVRILILLFLLLSLSLWAAHRIRNNVPRVEILQPPQNSVHRPNSRVPYSISVSDVEDGESSFGEIPSDRILLEIRYSRKGHSRTSPASDSSKALVAVLNRGCFSCHRFRDVGMAPSFAAISERYRSTSEAPEQLVRHIIRGSRGVWGEAMMPAHPDLAEETAHVIALWILSAGANDGIDYQTGKEGVFPVREETGFLDLKASYTDRGLPGVANSSRTGRHEIRIEIR